MHPHGAARNQLDRLFAADAVISVVFGILALGTPHRLLQQFFTTFSGGAGVDEQQAQGYNHSVHETVRLYACLRIACGWILWHVRRVDDGLFRKHVCEALAVCYVLQALSVLRAQFTDRHTFVNWVAITALSLLSFGYGSFRLRKGGSLIKVYELPTSSTLS